MTGFVRLRRLAAASLAAVLAGPVVALPVRAAVQAPVASEALHFPHAIASGASMHTIQEIDDGAAIGGVQIFVAAGLDREAATSSGLAALTAESIVRSREMPGLPAAAPAALGAAPQPSIRDAIAASGGLLQYTVEGRSVHFYVEAPGDRLAALVTRFGQVLAAPSFTPDVVDAARASLSARATDLESSALAVGVQMFRRSHYEGGAGQPALGTSASLAAFTSRDAQTFYRTNYVREAVSASAVGKIDAAVPAAIDLLTAALPHGNVEGVVTATKAIPAAAPRLVSRRDVGAPQVVVGFTAPSPSSADFGAMLVLESLLSNAFERGSATSLSEPERAVGAFYLYDTTPASIVVYVNGARVDPSVALRELVLVSRSLARTKLTAPAFARFKATAQGTFVTGTTTIADRSYLLGELASQGLGPDAINAALASLDRTTAADVQRAAKRYLQRFVIALVLPRTQPTGAGS